MKFLVLIFFLVQSSFAETSGPYPTEGSEVVPQLVKPSESVIEKTIEDSRPLEEVRATVSSSRVNRASSFGSVMLGYQLLTTWIPSKTTLSYTHIFNERWSLEGEYAKGSLSLPVVGIDIGEVSERQLALRARYYTGNSFHFLFGGVLSDYRARLGSDVLDRFGNEINADLKVQTLGVMGGIGNRWQWSNGVTFGVDWFRMNVPLFETRIDDEVIKEAGKSSDRSDLRRVIRTFERIPTFVAFGLNLGYTF